VLFLPAWCRQSEIPHPSVPPVLHSKIAAAYWHFPSARDPRQTRDVGKDKAEDKMWNRGRGR
jgi:hypothetical protein